MKRNLGPLLIALGMLAGACTSGTGSDAEPPVTDPGSDVTTSTTGPSGTDPIGTEPPVTEPGDPVGPIGFAPAALRRFDECQSFLDYVHTEGVERVGPYGFDNGWFGPFPMFDEDIAVMTDVEEEAADQPAAEPTAEPVAPPATDSAGNGSTSAVSGEGTGADDSGGGDGTFSTTNVQVEGVDEPDIVKTDGERVLALTDSTLHYIDISDDGSTGTLRGSIDLSTAEEWGYGHEILLAGDRAFVIHQGERQYGVFPGGVPEEQFVDDATVVPVDLPDADVPDAVDEIDVSGAAPEDVPAETAVDAEESFAEPETEPAPPIEEPLPDQPLPVEPGLHPGGPYYFAQTTVIIEVDLSNPDDLRVANRLSVDGRYISARAIGNTARIVVTSPPQEIGFLYPSGQAAEEAARTANQDLIRNTTIDDWMPDYTLVGPDGSSSEGDLVSCDNIHAPSEFSGFDMLSIVTIGLDEPLSAPTASSAVLASGETVYASADRMYVSTNVWLPPTIADQQRGIWEENYETAIHRFSIAGDGPANYEASGSVDGHLLNQFSMNDRDGTLYAATTTGSPWGGGDSVSQIVALQVDGDRLEQVGKVGGLGETERIFSVRYVDDIAYVVTFRQTDPFYVVDIADPTAMRVLGELKIPGFSSYLHPITDTLVLGVGQDATDQGVTLGTKISLFDVSDPGDPREIDVWTMPNSNSDVEFDHRAFLYWAETGTAVFPITSWSEPFTGAIVLDVSESGLEERGRITQVDPTGDVTGSTDCRVIEGDFSESDGDLFWITQDPSVQIQLCDPGDIGGASGFVCEPIPLEEARNWFWFEQGTLEDRVDLDGVERVEWCWRDSIDWQRQIRRTLIIDGHIWSLSHRFFQSNDLGSLDRTERIDLFG